MMLHFAHGLFLTTQIFSCVKIVSWLLVFLVFKHHFAEFCHPSWEFLSPVSDSSWEFFDKASWSLVWFFTTTVLAGKPDRFVLIVIASKFGSLASCFVHLSASHLPVSVNKLYVYNLWFYHPAFSITCLHTPYPSINWLPHACCH